MRLPSNEGRHARIDGTAIVGVMPVKSLVVDFLVESYPA